MSSCLANLYIVTIVSLIVSLNINHSLSCLTHILGFKMLIFGLCFVLYFLKLSAGIGFLTNHS